MSRAERYEDLAQLFAYPWRREALDHAVARLLDGGAQLASLASFLAGAPLGAVQEAFVAAFDLDPRCAPYAGHHLHGEHRRRAEYLVSLKEAYRRHGFEGTAGEPPDHLPTMFQFAAHLERVGREGEAAAFVAEYLLEGMRKMRQAADARHDFTWKEAVAAACAVCAADCEEARSCSIPSSS